MLNLQITLIVPSKTKDGKKLSLIKNKTECMNTMGEMFGGATAGNIQDGCYVMDSGKIMHEKTVSITSYVEYNIPLQPFYDFVFKIKSKYKQECIAIIINNEMKFL